MILYSNNSAVKLFHVKSHYLVHAEEAVALGLLKAKPKQDAVKIQYYISSNKKR